MYCKRVLVCSAFRYISQLGVKVLCFCCWTTFPSSTSRRTSLLHNQCMRCRVDYGTINPHCLQPTHASCDIPASRGTAKLRAYSSNDSHSSVSAGCPLQRHLCHRRRHLSSFHIPVCVTNPPHHAGPSGDPLLASLFLLLFPQRRGPPVPLVTLAEDGPIQNFGEQISDDHASSRLQWDARDATRLRGIIHDQPAADQQVLGILSRNVLQTSF